MMKRLSGLVLLLCLANFLSAQDMRMEDFHYMVFTSVEKTFL